MFFKRIRHIRIYGRQGISTPGIGWPVKRGKHERKHNMSLAKIYAYAALSKFATKIFIERGIKKIKDGEITVSMDQLYKSFNIVRRELAAMGVLSEGSPLDEVNCYNNYIDLKGFAGIMGYCEVDGDIYIPCIYPVPLWDLKSTSERNLTDTIRHEFGHAMADRYKKFFTGRRSKVFKEAFGEKYGIPIVDGDFSELWYNEIFISPYAQKNTAEDWSETFMYYLKHKGRLPIKWRKYPFIKEKWEAVKTIIELVAKEV